MLDPRIYRAALIPIVFALIVGAFSLSDPRTGAPHLLDLPARLDDDGHS